MEKTKRIFAGMGVLVLLVLLGVYFWANRAEECCDMGSGVGSVRDAAPKAPSSPRDAPTATETSVAVAVTEEVLPDAPWTPYIGAWVGQKSFISASRRSGEPVDAYAYLVVGAQGDVALEISRKMASDGEMHGHFSMTKSWPGDFGRDGNASFASPDKGEIQCWWYAAQEGQITIPITKVVKE